MREHEPTEKTKSQVMQASGLGLPQEQIAALLGVTAKTLRKHYEIELGLGKAQASAQIAKSLFNKALKGDTTAMIWWTKAQMRWSETVKQELTGANGETLIPSIQVTFVRPNEVGKTG